MKKYIEICLPLLLGGLLALILYIVKIPDIVIYRVEFVMNAIITCVTTLTGFVLTSVSIIIGASSSPIMQKIRNDGGLKELVLIYTEALILSLAVIILFIVLGANIGEDNLVSSNWIIVCAGVLLSYICSMIVTSTYLLLIISKMPSNQTITSKEEATVPPGTFR